MAVLFYQIGIFLAIQIASFFGKSARNTAIILITIFTLLQVFISWLLLLQLITIFISYSVSKRWFENSENKNIENQDEETWRKTKIQENIRKEARNSYEYDPEMRNAVDAILNDFSKRAKGTHPSQNIGINLKTRFYYIDHSQTYGPVTAQKLIRLVKSNRINKNSYIRQVTEENFEMRAHEIVNMFK